MPVTDESLEVLLVDDELSTRELLEQFCRSRNLAVTTASDGRAAITALERNPSRFTLVLTDINMPGADGFEVLKTARAGNRSCYVVMITGYATLDSALRAVREGAYDYLAKPFSLEELLARLRALLRRVTSGAEEVLRFADLELSPNTREVSRGGETIELTRTEFNLLELFLRNPRQVLTRSVIFERVWGYDFGFASNSLDVYIGYLRRKTEQNGRPRLIQTVRGVGYALREP
jgi:two-component system response regulator MprA